MKDFFEIDKGELKKAYSLAYSIENMEGWEAENRRIEYIGSTEKAGRITDYYKDSAGEYWFGSRHRRKTGEIVSMETFIFGNGFQEREKERRKRRYVIQKNEREEERRSGACGQA